MTGAATGGGHDGPTGLLSQGARINVQIADGETAGGETVLREDANTARQLLAGAPRKDDDDGTTYLMGAARAGDLAAVKRLIADGEDVNARNIYDLTPLVAAIGEGHFEIVKLLVRKGADINDNDGYGPPLTHALDMGQSEIAEFLINKGARLDLRDGHGATPLWHAASYGYPRETVRLMIKRGADVNTAANGEWTALMVAAERCHLEIVKLLIDKGADVNAKSENGNTALDDATRNGCADIAEFLKEHGAKSGKELGGKPSRK